MTETSTGITYRRRTEGGYSVSWHGEHVGAVLPFDLDRGIRYWTAVDRVGNHSAPYRTRADAAQSLYRIAAGWGAP
jgi:hypothetical protein